MSSSASSNVSYNNSGSGGAQGSGGGAGGGSMDLSGGGAMEAIEHDPSTGASFFSADFKRHDDLKTMLDSNKDSLKLEAMKRIIGMLARGRDAKDLFPAVVKNVVSKNIEVRAHGPSSTLLILIIFTFQIKKLVYVYLTRYAEEQQDLALLSISTFQRALKDPNQLIRASALRVLSSIRVTVIVPIMMSSIRDSAVDMSPFVRKTAAHAIPKLHSLDPDSKDELVGVIEKLLGDRTTLVVGSAVMAFEEVSEEKRLSLLALNWQVPRRAPFFHCLEGLLSFHFILCSSSFHFPQFSFVLLSCLSFHMVRWKIEPSFYPASHDFNLPSPFFFYKVCPERIELVHKNFRKFCNLLVDVEEWGQVVIINMLSRYARTQFTDPNAGDALEELTAESKDFYENSEDEAEEQEELAKRTSMKLKMDPDHRLLLRSAKPLLQSRNASVVMATAQLFHHCAPKAEVQA